MTQLAAVLLCTQLSLPAVAQDNADPLFADADESEADEGGSGAIYADLMLRNDHTTGLAGREDIHRLRSRLRLGWQGQTESFEYAIAAKFGLGSDDNRTNRTNLDNEKSDGAGLDEAFLRWQIGESTRLTLGKTELPLVTTPLTWDSDLRPAGASVSHDAAIGDFDRISVVAGYFAPQHLYDDDSRLGAIQLGWHWHEGAPFSAEVLVGYLDFDDLQTLTREGLARTNRRRSGVLISDYRLLDLQGEVRWDFDGRPLAARLDLVKNLGADDLDKGARLSLIYGDSRQPGGLELAVSVQRFQRDAVMAAFSSDDWWFHSFARGVMPWVGYGFNETWSMQLSAFHERRDDQAEYVDRYLLDVRAVW